MANRYWVGGSGNLTNTNHWSLTSGGTPGASIPTSNDDVFIDSNSGLSGGTITLDDLFFCKNFTSNSGFTYTITDENLTFAISIYGSAIFESGLTIHSADIMIFLGNLTNIISFNGVRLECKIRFGSDGTSNAGTWKILDNLTLVYLDPDFIDGSLSIINGTFDANNKNINVTSISAYADTDYHPTIIMGNGTWIPNKSQWILSEHNGFKVNIIPKIITIECKPLQLSIIPQQSFFFRLNKPINRYFGTDY